MMRREFTAAFKRKVVLEALRDDETVPSIAARHGVHSTQVSEWKAEAHEGLLEVFAPGREEAGGAGAAGGEKRKYRPSKPTVFILPAFLALFMTLGLVSAWPGQLFWVVLCLPVVLAKILYLVIMLAETFEE